MASLSVPGTIPGDTLPANQSPRIDSVPHGESKDRDHWVHSDLMEGRHYTNSCRL